MRVPVKCEGCWYDDLYPYMTDFLSGNLEFKPSNVEALRSEIKEYVRYVSDLQAALISVKPTAILDKDGNQT